MAGRAIGVDTSVAIPLLVGTHPQHRQVLGWAHGKSLYLAGHAAVETYSVLTRLPGDMCVAPADAARQLDTGFDGVLVLDSHDASEAHCILAALGIAGGAAYDGLVALAAKRHEMPLATRDARARGTYERVGVSVELLAAEEDNS